MIQIRKSRLRSLVVTIIAVLVPALAQSTSPREILSRARPAVRAPQTLTCQAYATLTFRKDAPVLLHLSYAYLAPESGKMILLSRLTRWPEDINFSGSVGKAYVLHSARATQYSPFFSTGHRIISPQLPHQSPEVSDPHIMPWLASMLHLARAEEVDARYLALEDVNGTRAHLIEFIPKTPVYPILGHQVARYQKWFDAAKGAPVRAVAYNAKGETVEETAYEEVKEVAPNKWVAFKTTRRIQPCSIPLKREMSVSTGGGAPQQEVWRAELPWPARTIVHEYEWVEERVALPKTISVIQESNLICHMRFFGYILDLPLDPSEFSYEPIE